MRPDMGAATARHAISQSLIKNIAYLIFSTKHPEL
jgi:hypothetical protein